MTEDEFARRQQERIIAHWRAEQAAKRDAPPATGEITDADLARLQREATERAARNWDPDEAQDFEGGPEPIAGVIADGLEALFDRGPNKTPFLGPTYLTEYLQSDHWRATRDRALKRAGGYCQRCHERRRALDVHHLTYRNVGQERESELLVLCRQCHELEHGRTW